MNKQNSHPSSNHRVYQFHCPISESKREGGNIISGSKSNASKKNILTKASSRVREPRRRKPPNENLSNAKDSRIASFVDQVPNHRANPYTCEKKTPTKMLPRARQVKRKPHPKKSSQNAKASHIPRFDDQFSNHRLNQCHNLVFEPEREGKTLLRTRRVRRRPTPSKAPRKVKISRIPTFVQPSTNHQIDSTSKMKARSNTIYNNTAEQQRKRIEERHKKRLQQPIVNTDILLQNIEERHKKRLQQSIVNTDVSLQNVQLKKSTNKSEVITFAREVTKRIEERYKRRLEQPIMITDTSVQDINRQLKKSAKKGEVGITFANEETRDEIGDNNLEVELISSAESNIIQEEANNTKQGLNSSQADSRLKGNVIALKIKRDTSMRTLKLSMGECGRLIGRKDTWIQGSDLKEDMDILWNIVQTLKSRLILRESKFHTSVADSEMRK